MNGQVLKGQSFELDSLLSIVTSGDVLGVAWCPDVRSLSCHFLLHSSRLLSLFSSSTGFFPSSHVVSSCRSGHFGAQRGARGTKILWGHLLRTPPRPPFPEPPRAGFFRARAVFTRGIRLEGLPGASVACFEPVRDKTRQPPRQ